MGWRPKGLRFDDVPESVLLREPLATEVRPPRGGKARGRGRARPRTHLNALPALLAIDAVAAEQS